MKTFLISDTHFGHVGMTKFLREDGTKVRPFDDVDEMNEVMANRWNETVAPTDKVYHLGDFAIPRKGLAVSHRLNGRKILIKGNHDIFKPKDYEAFVDMRAYQVLDNILLSHIPVHPGSKGRYRANVHGHTHTNVVTDHNGHVDPWYIAMSVEHWDYTPVDFELIRERVNE